jgi:site-specific DNA recombinase
MSIDDKERKVGIYLRVSTGRQAEDGDSLDEQSTRLRAYCTGRGWNQVAEYREEGWSAKNTNRPQIKRLLSDVKIGNINTVVVKKIDRLTRSLADFEQLRRRSTNTELTS